MGNRFNANHAFSRIMALNIRCLLSISNLCHGNSSNQNESYMLIPEYGAGGLETIPANMSIAIATTVLHPGPTLPA